MSPDDYEPDIPECDGDGHLPHPTKGCSDYNNGSHYWCAECPGCPKCEPDHDELVANFAFPSAALGARVEGDDLMHASSGTVTACGKSLRVKVAAVRNSELKGCPECYPENEKAALIAAVEEQAVGWNETEPTMYGEVPDLPELRNGIKR